MNRISEDIVINLTQKVNLKKKMLLSNFYFDLGKIQS